MRITTAAFLATAAMANARPASKPLLDPNSEVKAASPAGGRLLEKARKLGGGNDYNSYTQQVQSYYNKNMKDKYGNYVYEEDYQGGEENDANYPNYSNGYKNNQEQAEQYSNAYDQNQQNYQNRQNGQGSWNGNGNENDNAYQEYQNNYQNRQNYQSWQSNYQNDDGNGNNQNGNNQNGNNQNGNYNNQNNNNNQNQDNGAQDEDVDYSQYAGNEYEQQANQWGSGSWLQDYSIKFDGCAVDMSKNDLGQARGDLLARFKLCPNSSGRMCMHSGEYVVPMPDFVEAYQNTVASDENCVYQEEECFQQCLEQARYGSAYDDDGSQNGAGRKLQKKAGRKLMKNKKAARKLKNGGKDDQSWKWRWNWWSTVSSEDEKKQDEQYQNQNQEDSTNQYQKQRYQNMDYSVYNGGNNENAAHNGAYDASGAQGQYYGSYEEEYAAQSAVYGNYTEAKQQEYEEGNWNNKDESSNQWRSQNKDGGDNEWTWWWNNNDNDDNDNEDGDYNYGNQNSNRYNGYNNGNNNYGQQTDYNNYFDEGYCRYQCMADAGMSFCNENTIYNGQNGYQEFNLLELIECHELEYSEYQSKPLWVGATCRNGGVYLDTFTDPYCTNAARRGTHENAVGYALPQENLVNGDLTPCDGTTTFVEYHGWEDYEEYKEYQDSQYQNAVGLCDTLYNEAGRCEEHMNKDNKDNGACGYINGMGKTNHVSWYVWFGYSVLLFVAVALMLAAFIGYKKAQRGEQIVITRETIVDGVRTVQTSVTTLLQKQRKSMENWKVDTLCKSPLSGAAGDAETVASTGSANYIAADYIAATLPVPAPATLPVPVPAPEEPMTTDPIEEVREVTKEEGSADV